jgi:hypothetical protein
VTSVLLVGDTDISKSTQRAIPPAAEKTSRRDQVQATLTAPARPTRTTVGDGATVNAYADRTQASNQRLISLAGYDMHDVTIADGASSDETTLIGTLQLQAAIDARVWRAAADRSTDGRTECSGCSG